MAFSKGLLYKSWGITEFELKPVKNIDGAANRALSHKQMSSKTRSGRQFEVW